MHLPQEMNEWTKDKIDNYISEFSSFYLDCSTGTFSGLTLPTKLNKKELEYLNDNLNLHEIIGVQKRHLFNEVLKDSSKDNFSFYLLRTLGINFSINNYDKLKSTCFIELAKKYFATNTLFFTDHFVKLFHRGYDIKIEDEKFVEQLYKKVRKPEDFEKWMYLRFAVLLKDGAKFEYALSKNKQLFTLLSFKLKRPIYFNMQNLLKVAINGLSNYRECGMLILDAINTFDVEEHIYDLDIKNGTFFRKRNEFLDNRPIQDKDLEEIAKIILPELK